VTDASWYELLSSYMSALATLTRIASYRALIRHDGNHWTKTLGHKCWNTELIESANLVLRENWTNFDTQIATAIDQFLVDIKKAMDHITASATSTCPSESYLLLHDAYRYNSGEMAPLDFIVNMRKRQKSLRYLLDKEFAALMKSLG